MWTLECDGPLFGHKKKWLRPGSRLLIGRTKPSAGEDDAAGFQQIDNKSVSKKHLIISVAPVEAGDGSKIHARSVLTIEDTSKIGTTVDGEKIKQTTKILKGNEHAIQLGKFQDLLRIRWHPVVFTVLGNTLSKADKQNADPFTSTRQRLEQLDIKFVQDFVRDQTTHVVTAKRNVPPALEALVLGRYVVFSSYLDAVSTAALEGPSGSASLEADFEANWPDPMAYVPPSTKEPVPRPAEYFAPKPERASVFSGYMFVFCQSSKYESLHGVITAGGGKALLYEKFDEGRTTAKDFITYVKNVAGEKGLGEFEDGSEGKGVVVIRLVSPDSKDWGEKFVHEVDGQLNQRSLELSEFLDVIIMNDTSSLRRPLTEEIDMTSTEIVSNQPIARAQSRSFVEEQVPAVSQPTKAEPPASIKRRGRRPLTQSRFKGFDDFDPSQLPKFENIPEAANEEEMPSIPSQDMEVPPHVAQLKHRAADSRKRASSPMEDQDDVIDDLLPANAAMKRRRLDKKGTSITPVETGKQAVANRILRKTKKEPEIDVLEIARSRREAEDEAARKDAESLKEAMEGMDIEGPARLIAVEEMRIEPRDVPNHNDEDGNEKWRGRKNFKGFRRKGEAQPMRGHRVIVRLEETKKKGFGIGEDYWLEPTSKQKKTSQRESQPVAEQSQTLRHDEDDGSQFRRKGRSKQKAEEDEVQVVEESFQPEPSEVPKRTTRQTQESQTTQKGKKRAAAEPPREIQPVKKKGRAFRRDEESESSEDELKFRSRRRR